MTTAHQRQLLRQLEAQLRKHTATTDTRRQLTATGMTTDEIWAIELPIRRQIRTERAERPAA